VQWAALAHGWGSVFDSVRAKVEYKDEEDNESEENEEPKRKKKRRKKKKEEETLGVEALKKEREIKKAKSSSIRIAVTTADAGESIPATGEGGRGRITNLNPLSYR